MFSKATRFSSFFLIAALGLSGCGDFLQGKPKPKDGNVIELSDEKFQALSRLPDLTKDLSDGTASEGEIREFGKALREALVYFRQRTKGSVQDAYTQEELRAFFQKFFLKGQDVSPQLAGALMKLKKALFGGTDDLVYKAEIDRLVTVLKVLEDELVNVAPHLKILLALDKDISIERLHGATAQVTASLKVLIRNVDLARSDYGFPDIKEFVQNLGQFTTRNGLQPSIFFDQLDQWMPLAEAIKNVLFGEEANLVGATDWNHAIETTVSLYDLGLQYYDFLQGHLIGAPVGSHIGPEDVHATLGFLDQLITTLEKSSQMRRLGEIPFRQVDRLIDLVLGGDKKLISTPLTAKTLKDFYRLFVLSFLDPVRHGDNRGADSIERIHLLSLRRELNIYRLNQAFVDWSAPGDGVVLSRDQLMKAITQFPAEQTAQSLIMDTAERNVALAAFSKFKELLLKKRPIAFDDKGSVIVTYDVDSLTWTWRSLNRFNLMHFLTRGFLLGYGDDKDPAKAGCSEQTMIRWYDEFHDIGNELKIFDPRVPNSGARSFKEAIFFTYSGNGGDRINMDMLFEYISLLVGGGLGNAGYVQTQMETSGCLVGEEIPVDVFGNRLINEVCFRKELREHFSELFGNLPALAAYVKSLDDQNWSQFVGFLMQASRDSDPRKGMVETSDIRTATMILHYTETLFTVFDLNRDNGLSLQETRMAAPRFLEFLRTLSPVKNDTFVTEAFVALVFTGKKPDAWGLAGIAKNQILEWLHLSRTVPATRGDLIKVFGSLRAELSRPKAVR